MPPKTARERAEEALAVAERRVKKLVAKKQRLNAQIQDAEKELGKATAQRDYAAKHPDLADNGIISLPGADEASKSFESSHKAKP